jgi:adenylate cyclase
MAKKYSFKEFSEERWIAVLHGEQRLLKFARNTFKYLPADKRCKFCNAPLSGFGVPIARLMGSRQYPKNPRFCTGCLWSGELGGVEIELTMLFADICGSTSMAETISPTAFSEKLNRFYKVATNAVADNDGWLDNLVGDGLIALFIPGFAGDQHASKAVSAAFDLLESTGHADPDGPWLPVGVGVHTGKAFVGLVGSEGGVSDLTAVGDAMNTTARLSSEADQGEIIISESSSIDAGVDIASLETRQLSLKGKSEPMDTWVIKVSPT